MKRLLLVFAAVTLVLFSSCRHDDFDLLRHPVHIQGGANIHLGTPIGNGEMTVDNLFDMINDPTIDSLMDSTSNLITLRFETTIDTVVSGSSMNINFKKVVDKMKVKDLPWGQGKVNRRWQPIRRSNDRKWSPTRSNRVVAAKSGAYTRNAPKTGTVDNIFSYADTISYAMNLDMLSGSSFFSDADFELNTVDFNLNMTLNAQCAENVRHYLDDYITFTIDSVMIFYTDADGNQHLYNHPPFDGSMAPMVYGHDSPTGVGITQQPMVIPFTNVNIAEIVNSKPTSIRARFRFKLDVARSMVLDVVSRPEFDTTGLFLTGIDLNTIDLSDVSNLDSATLMNNIQNNLANIDTLATINYLFNANIDTTDPQTVLDFLNIDTAFVLNYLGIDTTQPRTVLYAAGIADTSDIALAAGANLPLDTLANGDVVFDTCELIYRATDHAVQNCSDTNGMIAAVTHDSGYHDGAIDTNYFIALLTGNPNLTMDSTGALLGWVGIDTSESNINTLLLEAGVDTSDHDAILDSLFGHHLANRSDTTALLQTILGNPLNTSSDTTALVTQILGNPLATENDTNALIAQITGHPWNDTNYYLQQITGNPTITSSDTNALVQIATGHSTSDTAYFINEATGCSSQNDTNCILQYATGHSTSDTSALLSMATGGTVTSTTDTNAMLYAATGHYKTDTNFFLNLATNGAVINKNDTNGLLIASTGHAKTDTNFFLNLATNGSITSKTDTCGIIKASTNNAITNCNDTTQYMNAFGIDTTGIVNSIDTTGMIDPAEYVGMTPAQIQARKDQLYDHLRDSVENAMKAQVEDSITQRVQKYVKNTVGDYIADTVGSYVKHTVGDYIADTVSNYVNNTVSAYIKDTVQKFVNKRVSHTVRDNITGYFNPRIETYVRETVTDYVTDTVTNYVVDTLTSYIEDTVAKYVEKKLGKYLEETIKDTIQNRMRSNIVPRIKDYIVAEVTDYVSEKIIKAYQDTILNYLKAQVRDYVTDVIIDTMHAYMNERIENFTSLKDTLVGIMNDVSQSNYACNVTLAVNIPFEMKIGSLAYPMDVEIWKDGQNPIDVDAILSKLPNFIDASLDDSYFNMKVANGMPLEFVVNAELLDANKLTLCTLIENDTIKAAQLVQDENNPTCYYAGDSTISVIRATMNQEKLKKIKDSKYVRMNMTLTTNNQFVYVRKTDKMAFRAFLQANANANVDIPVPHTPLPIPNIF